LVQTGADCSPLGDPADTNRILEAEVKYCFFRKRKEKGRKNNSWIV
jgi:hypothetical protein